MKMTEYIRRHDLLPLEEPFFEIPVRKEYVLRELGRGKRVLDLGCLGGQISRLIKDQNNEVYGVELNPKAAAAAEALGIRVKVFDLNDGIPFEDEFFDAVNAGEIIENIYDTKFLFEEVNRVLKPQGLFIFSTPNLNSLSNRLRVLSGGYLGRMGTFPEDHYGGNIRIFNIPKIHELCLHTGFKVVDIIGVPLVSKQNRFYQMLRPLVKVRPQFAELLVVKARKRDV